MAALRKEMIKKGLERIGVHPLTPDEVAFFGQFLYEYDVEARSKQEPVYITGHLVPTVVHHSNEMTIFRMYSNNLILPEEQSFKKRLEEDQEAILLGVFLNGHPFGFISGTAAHDYFDDGWYKKFENVLGEVIQIEEVFFVEEVAGFTEDWVIAHADTLFDTLKNEVLAEDFLDVIFNMSEPGTDLLAKAIVPDIPEGLYLGQQEALYLLTLGDEMPYNYLNLFKLEQYEKFSSQGEEAFFRAA